MEICVNRNERPHSFEFGKAGLRHKIYYEDEEDLCKQIDIALKGEAYLAQIAKDLEVRQNE